MAEPAYRVQVEGIDLALAALKKWGPRELEVDMRRANMVAARIAARAIKATAPVGKTGNLKKSVRARRARPGFGAVVAGPLGGRGLGAHRHLVIRGHRIVTVSGRDTGRRSRPNPFVDRAVSGIEGQLEEVVRRELAKG